MSSTPNTLPDVPNPLHQEQPGTKGEKMMKENPHPLDGWRPRRASGIGRIKYGTTPRGGRPIKIIKSHLTKINPPSRGGKWEWYTFEGYYGKQFGKYRVRSKSYVSAFFRLKELSNGTCPVGGFVLSTSQSGHGMLARPVSWDITQNVVFQPEYVNGIVQGKTYQAKWTVHKVAPSGTDKGRLEILKGGEVIFSVDTDETKSSLVAWKLDSFSSDDELIRFVRRMCNV